MAQWQPLNREQALAARDFSRAGETFIDHKGQVHEILYATLTPLGYQVYVSPQAIHHLSQHAIAARHQMEIPHLLNNPDLIAPNFEFRETHLYYKVITTVLLVVAVHHKAGVRFVATVHKAHKIKGLHEKLLSPNDFLYIRGGFKWKKWK